MTVPTTPPGIAAAFAGYEGARVVIEVGTHSPWLSRALRDRGFEVVVANPRRVRLIAASHRNSDKSDAEMLARLGRVDPSLLAPVVHRDQQAQEDLGCIRAREGLVRARSSLVLMSRGLVKGLGLRLPGCSTEAFPKVARRALHDRQVPGLTEALAAIESLTSQIRALDRQIEQIAQDRYPETQQLTQVNGVGTLTALCFILTVHDPSRFKSSRDCAAYLGLVPKQRDSGERTPQLGISKQGDRHLRRLLVGSARYIMGPFGKDSDLRTFGLSHSALGGAAARNRAAIAVARKLAVLLHRLWLTAEVYEPVGYSPTGAHLLTEPPASIAA
jgi:transposase